MSAAFDVATLLQTLAFGTVGTDIGVNAFIDNADAEIAVFEFAGEPDLTTHGGVAFSYPSIQVQVRRPSTTGSLSAQQKCQDIYKALSDRKDQTVNAHLYQYFEPKMTPQKLSVDEDRRTIWYCEIKTHRSPE